MEYSRISYCIVLYSQILLIIELEDKLSVVRLTSL